MKSYAIPKLQKKTNKGLNEYTVLYTVFINTNNYILIEYRCTKMGTSQFDDASFQLFS